jgi:hypothetical protein
MIFNLPRDKTAALAFLTPDFARLKRWSDEIRAKDPQLARLREECKVKLASKKVVRHGRAG